MAICPPCTPGWKHGPDGTVAVADGDAATIPSAAVQMQSPEYYSTFSKIVVDLPYK